jgi:hypothetical protein
MSKEYWQELVRASFDDRGITATDQQVNDVANDIMLGVDRRHMYERMPENPLIQEVQHLKLELKREQQKQICPECNGKGSVTSSFGTIGRRSISTCYRCNGSGFR